MELTTKETEYESSSAKIRAYVAYGKSKNPLPGLILIHEIFGLNDHIKDVARRFAAQGYAVIAPHLYSRPESPTTEEIGKTLQFISSIRPANQKDPAYVWAQMEKLPENERGVVSRVWSMMMNMDYTAHVKDLRAAVEWLSSQDFVNKHKIGCIGFCMGGTLAGRLASSGENLSAAIIFYGEDPPADQIDNIRCPILGLYGAEDRRITDRVPEFEKEMKIHGKRFEYHIYAGAYHAFFNDTGKNYNEEAATDAWKRANDFLSKNLKA